MSLGERSAHHSADWRPGDSLYANALQLSHAIEIYRELLLTGAVRPGASRPAICDLGAGAGCLTAMLGCVGDTLGVELNGATTKDAGKRFSHARFQHADIMHWEFPRSLFDVVVSHDTIEHIKDQSRYIDVAYGLLKPGGWLVLTTPNARTLNAASVRLRARKVIDSVLSAAQLRGLLETQFTNVGIRSFLPRTPKRALHRFFSSSFFAALAMRMGSGLHLIARAQKQE